jgi:hypothetical protein
MEPHQLLLPLFSCFISNTDCEFVYSNFLIDEIDMTIPISFLSKFVYGLYDLHSLVVYSLFVSGDIERGLNSFSFSLSI